MSTYSSLFNTPTRTVRPPFQPLVSTVSLALWLCCAPLGHRCVWLCMISQLPHLLGANMAESSNSAVDKMAEIVDMAETLGLERSAAGSPL